MTRPPHIHTLTLEKCLITHCPKANFTVNIIFLVYDTGRGYRVLNGNNSQLQFEIFGMSGTQQTRVTRIMVVSGL